MNVKITKETLERLPAGTWVYKAGGVAFGVIERFCSVQSGSGGHEVKENVGGIDCGKLPPGGPGQGGATKRYLAEARSVYQSAAAGNIEVFITPAMALKLAIMTTDPCDDCGGSGTVEKNGYQTKCAACAGSGVLPSKVTPMKSTLTLVEKRVAPSPSASNVPAAGRWER